VKEQVHLQRRMALEEAEMLGRQSRRA